MAELFSLVGTVLKALDYHAQRHNVLAANVANADTPGYRPLELVRPQPGGSTRAVPLRRTQAEHIRPAAESIEGELAEDRSAPIGADGNAVTLDREMAKMSANDVTYEAATSIVRRKLAELRYVAEDGRG